MVFSITFFFEPKYCLSVLLTNFSVFCISHAPVLLLQRRCCVFLRFLLEQVLLSIVDPRAMSLQSALTHFKHRRLLHTVNLERHITTVKCKTHLRLVGRVSLWTPWNRIERISQCNVGISNEAIPKYMMRIVNTPLPYFDDFSAYAITATRSATLNTTPRLCVIKDNCHLNYKAVL